MREFESLRGHSRVLRQTGRRMSDPIATCHELLEPVFAAIERRSTRRPDRAAVRSRRRPDQRRAAARQAARARTRARSPQRVVDSGALAGAAADCRDRRAGVHQRHVLARLPRHGSSPRSRPTSASASPLAAPRRRRSSSTTRRRTWPRRCTSATCARRSSATRSCGCSTFARPHVDPREPHRRLGHAVRHAHRAPARHRRGRGRRRAVASATSTASTRQADAKFDGRRRRSRSGPASGSSLLQSGDPETLALVAAARRRESTDYFNARLPPARRAAHRRRPRRREHVQRRCCRRSYERLDAAGLLQESDGAEVVFPPGFTNREGEPLPLIVRKRDGGFSYATSDLACVHRPRRAARRRPAALRRRRAAGAALRRWCSRSRRMAGWLVPPARGGARRVRQRARRRPQDAAAAAAGEAVKLIDLLDEAIERAAAAVAEKNPDLDRRRAGRRGAHGRHRRGEVRRPVDRPHQGLRLRLGPDAGVRRQHGAVPAVRPRPDLLDLPAGRGRSRDVRGDADRRSARRRSGRSPCACSAIRRRVAETLERYSPHRLCTYLFELAQDFTAFYEHCPVLKRRRAAPRAAGSRCATSPRGCSRTASACSASTPRSGCEPESM